MKIGIIGGSGLYEAKGFNYKESIKLKTPFGDPSDNYKCYTHNNHDFYFLARHGEKHCFPPHKVNYRANIDGFKQLGVEKIIAFTAVGAINPNMKPGDLVISDNGIDFTSGRISTFYEEGDIYHIDFTDPFCPSLRTTLNTILHGTFIRSHSQGTYVCTNGPRMETAAEIKHFKIIGADTVGMTLFPECTLAREREICYANVSIISNFAAGIGGEKLTTEEVVSTVKASENSIKSILEALPFVMLDKGAECECGNALNQNKINK